MLDVEGYVPWDTFLGTIAAKVMLSKIFADTMGIHAADLSRHKLSMTFMHWCGARLFWCCLFLTLLRLRATFYINGEQLPSILCIQ